MLFADFPPLEPISIPFGILVLLLGLVLCIWNMARTHDNWLKYRGDPTWFDRWSYLIYFFLSGVTMLGGICLILGWKLLAVWLLFGS
jgi:uncharacterized membrane protein